MNKKVLTLLFLSILITPSYLSSDVLAVKIPPTPAFSKIYTDNEEVHAMNYSMPLILQGSGGITVSGINNTHTIIINGTGSGGGSTNCTATTLTDEVTNRNLSNGTTNIYHNTSGKSILVMVSVFDVSPTIGSSGGAELRASFVNTAPNASEFIGESFYNHNFGDPALSISQAGTITAIIPNGYYYDLVDDSSGGGNAQIDAWWESTNPTCGTSTINNITNVGNQGTYNKTLANNVIINTGGFKTNYINGSGNPVHVVNSNSGQQVNITISSGSSGQNNTGANLGTSGTGVFASMSGSILQFLKLISANNQAVFSSNATNVILTIQHVITDAFKSNTTTCGAGYFMTAFNNGTGGYTCTPVSYTSNTVFKADTITCAGNTKFSAFNNVTGAFTCSGGTGAIQNGANIGTGGVGFFKNNTGSNINLRNLTTTRTDLFTLTQSSNNVNLASSFKSNSITCTNQFISAFSNTTGLYTCASPVTHIIAGTGISVNQTNGNVLVSNTGVTGIAVTSPLAKNATTGGVSLTCPTCRTDSGSIGIVINGLNRTTFATLANLTTTNNQTFLAKVNFTGTTKLAPINLGTQSNPTNAKNGDLWINSAGTVMTKDSGGNTISSVITSGVQTITGAKTLSGANTFSNNQTVSTGQNLYMGTANVTTTAVRGYFYFSAVDGTPTGTPASHTGSIPCVYDGKANKLWCYNGGWKSTQLS